MLAQQFEEIGRQECYNRLKPGDSHEMSWSLAPNPGAGPRHIKIIDARSLTPDGKRAWTKAQLQRAQERLEAREEISDSRFEISEEEKQILRGGGSKRRHRAQGAGADGKAEIGERITGGDLFTSTQALLGERQPAALRATLPSRPRQLHLLPPRIDDISMLRVPAECVELVFTRLKAVRTGINGDYHAAGYSTREPHRRKTADILGVSYRHYMRMLARFKESITPDTPQGDASVLMDKEPGPERGKTGFFRDAHNTWMVAYLNELHAQHYNKRECYEALLEEIQRKQAAWGAAYIYQIPSYETVCRFLRLLDPLKKAGEQGSASLKNACGYMDRSFEDISSGEMWCIDEWEVDAAAYLESDWRIYGRPWIVSLLDGRSKYILSWTITFKYTHDTVLDLLEDAVRRHGRPDYFYSDKGGRFRGRLGHNFREIDKSKLLDPGASVLEQLGTTRRGPGAEKNPRGNPIERRHRIFADKARLLPTWSGANTDERPERFDDQYALHKAKLEGKSDATGLVPLSAIRAWFDGVAEKYNHAPSGANGLRGLSPAAAYHEFSTDAERERRAVSNCDLMLAFSENYPQKTILANGIIEMPDGIRYSHNHLLLIQGEKRDIKRARHDKSCICVLPAFKGEEPIVAERRQRVGNHDPDALARHTEMLAAVRKIMIASLPEAPPLALDYGSPHELPDAGASHPPRADDAPGSPRLTKEIACEEVEAADFDAPRLHEIAPMTVEEV